jgi:hypothetical protein
VPRRLLIAAGAAADEPQQLPFGVRELVDAADEILVVTPALPGRLEWLASATDKARAEADERLLEILGHLRERGTPAEGTLGADDPLLAFDDALGRFPADHILIATRTTGDADWQEPGLIDRVRERFGLPVTAFSPAVSSGD